jgi:tetratricopeptide (TPR) repeat protein
VEVESQVLLRELEQGEWLGINPWSGREFKLPGASPPGERVAARREALRVDSDDAGAHQGLRAALTELGRFAASLAYQAPGHAEASIAAAAHREALRVDPDNAANRRALGDALLQLGRHEEATAAYREALRVDPDNAAARRALAGQASDDQRKPPGASKPPC